MNKPLSAIAMRGVETWQEQLQHAIRSPAELAQLLDIPLQTLGYSPDADDAFPLLVPRAFAGRMERGNPNDPLLRQVLAAREEDNPADGYTSDPLAEVSYYAGEPGVLQKYPGRALLIVTGQCAVNCRYCFRRHYPYSDNAQSAQTRLETIERLTGDQGINEIILSGGDPLLLPDAQLRRIRERLQNAGRPMTLRIHTRLPIVIPERVSADLLDALSTNRLSIVMVLHANHPNEIDADTHDAIARLRQSGITVLNQSVMLRGINDDAATLAALSERLFAAGALPYYIHLLDKVAGAAHFDVPIDTARDIMGELAEMQPGYLVPKLAMEVPGAHSKQELTPRYQSKGLPQQAATSSNHTE